MKHDDHWRAPLRDDATPEPADEGFTLRVMAALTVRRPRQRTDPWPARAAELLAMGSACAALAMLALQGPGGMEQGVAVGALLALLLWWSLPQSRGSQWR